MNLTDYFSDNYEESRNKFRNNFPLIKKYWTEASFNSYPLKDLNDKDTYTIDVIRAIPNSKDKRGVVITSGVHGAEGYAGAAVINFFMKEIAPAIDSTETGLILIHGINPWGMKHFRRANENNVDLNRNFIIDWDSHDKSANKDYPKLENLFNPIGKVSSNNEAEFFNELSKSMSEFGPEVIKQALSPGQYLNPDGIYYGGSRHEESTKFMINIFKECLDVFSRISLLDIHTGYGPRDKLILVNSPLEKKTPQEISEILDYPHVVEASEDDFYQIDGDIVDYVYHLFEKHGRRGHLFGTCMEYGTWGDNLEDTVRFLKKFFNENRLYNYGATDDETAEKVKSDFREMLYPGDDEWRQNVIDSSRKVLTAIIRENILV